MPPEPAIIGKTAQSQSYLDGLLEHAIELPIKAAETGGDDDVMAATDQIATVLRIWRMIE